MDDHYDISKKNSTIRMADELLSKLPVPLVKNIKSDER